MHQDQSLEMGNKREQVSFLKHQLCHPKVLGSEFKAKNGSCKVSYLTAMEVESNYPGTAWKRCKKSPLLLSQLRSGRKEAPVLGQ